MRGRRFWPVLLVAFVCSTAQAFGEVVVEGVHWQVGRVEHGRVVAWEDVRVLLAAPPKLSRLRARLVLQNRGRTNESGLLVRYSMTARVSPTKQPDTEGSWAIPFMVEERRVPEIAAGRTIEVPLDAGAAIDFYLKRLLRAGWWPDRIKIQAMIDPRRGAAMIQTVEDVLDIRHEARP